MQEFLHISKVFMNQNETYIASRIENGANPVDALAELMSLNNKDFRAGYPNKPENIKFEFILTNRFFNLKDLNLSIPFLQKWIVYPSGLVRSFMKYANIDKIVDLQDKLIVETAHPVITKYEDLRGGVKLVGGEGSVKYVGIKKGNKSISRELLLMIEEPLYIPVIRYAYETGKGFVFGDRELPTDYCGTYYWLEPDSGIYLLSNRTLVIPDRDKGLAALGVTKGINLLKRDTITDPEVKLCKTAERMGIDVVIMISEESHAYQYASEVIDIRNRPISYNSLYATLNQ